jgi:5-amino-6-(5-phosphoribosylamino)uracil reductase
MTLPSLAYPALTRPYTTVVLATSADGKIADAERSPARFGSPVDKHHLETQIAAADGVLFGAATLRAYGTTLRLTDPQLQQQRQQQGKPPQPIHIVCSRSADLSSDLRFFRQAVPRWLLTTTEAASRWQDRPEFERVLTYEPEPLSWANMMQQLARFGIKRLAVTGGGELVADLLAADLIDEVWLTICPLLLGGTAAPTPVGGAGFSQSTAPRLKLLSAETIGQEVFLHYQRQR